jgi:glycosidase
MWLNRRARLASIVPLIVILLSILPWQFAAANVPVSRVVQPLVQPNAIYADGLGHNSRDPLYRTPVGAQPAGTKITLRFRTFHDDVQKVTLRTLHTAVGVAALQPMERVARSVDCYAPQLPFVCDWWQATIDVGAVGTLSYQFIAEDGTKTLFYEDDSDVRNGGMGKSFEQSPDWAWTVGVYDPNVALPIQWMREAVVYQIFPDRFRNGDPANDPAPQPDNPQLSTAPRYAYPNGEAATGAKTEDDQIVRMPWGARPEGYCRSYAGVDVAECPQRFAQPGDDKEQPRGRDYFGGDLAGVTQKLDYLQSLGVTVIYFNPIFSAASNHRYDTRDYRIIDPYLGDLGDWQTLVAEAQARGMRIILDGVFNRMSADSPAFDRYGNWKQNIPVLAPSTLPFKAYVPLATTSMLPSGVGACQSAESGYRTWFQFRQPGENETAVCAPGTPGGPSYYNSWAGVASMPQLSEDPAVRNYIYGADDSVARSWLQGGASGWRVDGMGNNSVGFWRELRQRVKEVNPDAVIIGDLRKKLDVLPYVDGTTADTAMNYRLRDAVIGLLAPGAWDAQGFPGSGEPIAPSAFAERLLSIREDYGDAAFYTLMNLLDGHDTERLLWSLTPGADNVAEREGSVENVAEGKQRQRLAALIQMTLPGAPTIYYGDEVGLGGDNEPDNRRTFPWGDVEGDSRPPDNDMLAYYTGLTTLRRANDVFAHGDLQFLLTDDANGTLAYGRKAGDAAALVVLNTSTQAHKVTVPINGYLPNGAVLRGTGGCIAQDAFVAVENGAVTLELPPLCGAVLMAVDADLTPPPATTGLSATATDLTVELAWAPVEGAAGYSVYRSPVTGGGYVEIATLDAATTTYLDADEELIGGQRFFYVVKALDDKSNASAASNEASAIPAYPIAWASVESPTTLRYTIGAKNTSTEPVLGRVFVEGVTSEPGPTTNLIAQLGYGPQGSEPREWTTWTSMEWSADADGADEFKAVLQPTTPGMYSYLVRFSTSGGERWTYADGDGIGDGSFAQQTNRPGVLEVVPNEDQMPPAVPTNLQAANNDPTSIRLTWDAAQDPTLFRYDVFRSAQAGGEYVKIGTLASDTTTFTDTNLQTGTPYFYMVRAVDEAANVSPPSNEASAVP